MNKSIIIAGLLLGCSLGAVKTTTAKAYTWHHNTLPSTLRGYWHSSENTFSFTKSGYAYRLNGWNDIGSSRFRFPYHGIHNFKYTTTSSKHYYIIGKFDPLYLKTPVKIKRTKNHIGIKTGYYDNGKAHFPKNWYYLNKGAR